MNEERRKDTRYGIFIRPLQCREADCISAEVTINDISTSGVGITTAGRVVKEQKVELELVIPGDDVPLFLAGEVAWVNSDSNGRDIFHAGINTKKLSKCDRGRIVSYIKEQFYR